MPFRMSISRSHTFNMAHLLFLDSIPYLLVLDFVVSPSYRRINQPPAVWEFSCIKLLFDGPVFSHVIESIRHGIVIGIDDTLFVSGHLVVISVVTP